MRLADRFNATGLSRWLNSGTGRAFRFGAGLAFVAVGLVLHGHAVGLAALAWGVFPLSAGLLDICWVSAALGGPLSGLAIRARQGVVPARA